MTGAPVSDPAADAAELARLDAELPGLQARAVQAHQAFLTADAAYRGALGQRGVVAARLQAASASARSAPSVPSTPAMAPSGALPSAPVLAPAVPSHPETSTRTVQNVLFILGGLLLGTAAIAFTAVAWATFGVTGRAVILAVVTLITLGIPLVALARKLRATAETFAAIGLLLVVLDGYAAWYVNLGHVQSMAGTRYTGLVAAITAVVGYAYRRGTGLLAPAVMALVVGQPALILLATVDQTPPWINSLLGAATAILNLVVIWRTHAGRRSTALATIAWIFVGCWLLYAGLAALVAEATGRGVAELARAGLSTVVAGATLVVAARVSRQAPLVLIASGAFVPAVEIAATVLANAAWPNRVELVTSGVALAVSLAVLAATRALPETVRPGPRTGALIVAGVIGVVLTAIALFSATLTINAAQPFWHASLDPTGPTPPVRTWQLPLALLLVGLAFVLNAPQWTRFGLAAATGVLVVLAAPASLNLRWWVPAILSLAGAAVLVALARFGRQVVDRSLAGLGAAVLLGDALLTSTARPGLTAVVLAGSVLLGLALVVTARRSTVDGTVLAGIGALSGLLALPPAVGSALVAADVLPWWAARATVAAIVVLVLVVAVADRRARVAASDESTPEHDSNSAPEQPATAASDAAAPDTDQPAPVAVGVPAPAYFGGKTQALAAAAFLSTVVSAVVWPTVAVGVGHESVGVYAGISLLLIAAALVAGIPAGRGRPVALIVAAWAALPGLLAMAVAVVPAVYAVAALPYSWLTAIWTGRPSGVGLAPDEPVDARLIDAVALGLLAIACTAAIFGITRRVKPALGGLGIGGPTAILVALTAWQVPWPAVPAATLLCGLTLLLASALGLVTGWRATLAVTQAVVYVGAGIAGSLGVEWATLTALGSIVVAGGIIAAVGRTLAWRVVGVVVATAAAVAEAAAAGAAADLAARDIAYWVLAVAVVVLIAGAQLGRSARRSAEGRAAQGAAHAAAVVALLFTIGWLQHSALVCALWGLAVGLRALVPGIARAPRAALAAVAGGFELLAWWLLLVSRDVTFVEAYTLPLAAVALLAGWAALRSRPELTSWVAFGPALVAAFAPTLALILGTTGESWRRLALGAGALAVVVAGSVSRRRAPVVIGGVTLILVALHELVLLYQLLPGWVALAVGGLILVVLAVTYERRLRDLGRLRSSLQRMT